MEDKMDEMEVEILADGSVKFTTDEISGPNHGSAEELLRQIAFGMGGPVRRTKQAQRTQKQKQKLKA